MRSQKNVGCFFRISIWVVPVVLSLVFFGGAPAQAATSAAPAELKIGVVVSDTGVHIPQGTTLRAGITMAAEEINAAGGVEGKKIKLVFENDDSTSEKAQGAAKKLIYEDKVLAIIGTCGSETIYATQRVTEPEKVVLISHVGSTPKLTTEGQKYYFRNAISSVYQNRSLIEYTTKTLGVKRIGIGYDPGKTQSDYEALLKDLKAIANMEPVAAVTFQGTDVSFGPQILKLKGATPQMAVMLGGVIQIGAFARQSADMSLNAFVAGNANLVYDEYIRLAGNAAEGTVATATFNKEFANDLPGGPQFVQKYTAQFKEPPEHTSGQAYDLMRILAAALKGVSGKPEDLAKDREAIKNGLEKTTNFQGMAGTLSFGPGDHEGYKSQRIVTVKNGKWILAKTK